MKRSIQIGAASILLFIAGCADPINKANFDRIETGMTLQEVEKILGGRQPHSYETIKTWQGSNSSSITVEVDDRGLVVSKSNSGV